MKRNLLYLIGLICVGMLIFALHIQRAEGVIACQLCVLQRYELLLLALVCLVCAFFGAPRLGAGCGLIISLGGASTAAWQLWQEKNPAISCSLNSAENLMNHLVTAKYFPALFRVNGDCAEETYRLLSFSIPQWSLMAFLAFFALCLIILFVRAR